MIAPVAQRPRIPRHREIVVRRKEASAPGHVKQFIEHYPIPVIVLAVACGATVGWLVKRKEW